ncbi:hypothetical protein [Kineococcus sp. SYSU DK004]|uniref:hypothetical protein n=1 Tax=Kineococcus sp. SYSU DK004 TaxID=3383125 RepID=UPI003D7EBA11
MSRTTRQLVPGDRVRTSTADHEGVVLRPLRLPGAARHRLVERQVAAVTVVGPALPGLRRLVVEFTDGAVSQPVSPRATWPLAPARVIDLTALERPDAGQDAQRPAPLTVVGGDAPATARRGAAGRSPRPRRPAARGSAARAR